MIPIMPALCRCNGIGNTSAEKKYRAKNLYFLGPRIWSKIDASIENVNTSSSFTNALKKNILLHLQS